LKTDLDSKNEIVLYCYFDYKNQGNQRAENVVSSLLKRLLCSVSELPRDVESLYDDFVRRAAIPDLSCLSRIFISCSSNFSSVYLILDALDECQSKQLKSIVSLLGQLKAAQVTRHKILCTSRPHLEYLCVTLQPVAILDIEAHTDDVENYITWRLNDEWLFAEELKSEVVEAIAGRVEGK